METPSLSKGLGKYREIVIAVAFFLVFDLAVLILNFVISFQIADDALAINLAGRQRMLSQRMTKSLLQVDSAMRNNESPQVALDELRQTVALFSRTLDAFSNGGMTKNAQGQMVRLQAANDAAADVALSAARDLWLPFERALEPVLRGDALPAQVQAATSYATHYNVELLARMNELTTALESKAKSKADSLRLVQTAGIALALFNFVFILLKFVRRLQASDRLVEAAQSETDAILATVREGLFLVDQRYHIGTQQSHLLSEVLGRPCPPGTSFLDLLHTMVPPELFISARDYMELLLEGRVRERLVSDLNPLNEVAVRDPDGGTRHLSMRFNRAPTADGTPQLLVTVQDISRVVELQTQLEDAKRTSRSDFDALLRLLKLNPALLAEFVNRTREVLDEVNHGLQQADRSNYRRLIEHSFRLIHRIKGDASMLGLDLFERLAHACEQELVPLREMSEPTGEQLLALLPHLDHLFERLDQVASLLTQSGRREPEPAPAADGLERQLHALAERVAQHQHKQVQLVCDLDRYHALGKAEQQAVRDLFVQLLRNAIVHGIELPAERVAAGKDAVGVISIAVREDDGELSLEVRDDGAGINPRVVRAMLQTRGLYTAAQLEDMDDRQVVMKLFEPGVSTVSQPDVDAGHGVGLDVVQQQIRRLGGHLRLASRPGAFTLFHVRLYA